MGVGRWWEGEKEREEEGKREERRQRKESWGERVKRRGQGRGIQRKRGKKRERQDTLHLWATSFSLSLRGSSLPSLPSSAKPTPVTNPFHIQRYLPTTYPSFRLLWLNPNINLTSSHLGPDQAYPLFSSDSTSPSPRTLSLPRSSCHHLLDIMQTPPNWSPCLWFLSPAIHPLSQLCPIEISQMTEEF